MMYSKLAKYYDALVKDDHAVDMWISFFKTHKKGNNILELASGTGEITLALAKNFDVDASDVSISMLKEIKKKDKSKLVKNYYQLDMRDFSLDKNYDNIICFCDSINYILDLKRLENMFKNVYAHLNKDGVFMFDMHSLDRLEEFEEEFIEAGQVLKTDYQWIIRKEKDLLLHHFAFYENSGLSQEYHTQKVYIPEKIIKILKDIGFSLKIYTDFVKEGIVKGEKIFIVGRK